MADNFFMADNVLLRLHGRNVPGEPFRIYCCLISYADAKTRICKRRVIDLASELRLSPTTVREHLEKLVRYGLLEEVVPSTQGRSAVYRVVAARDVEPGENANIWHSKTSESGVLKDQNLVFSEKRKRQNLAIKTSESGVPHYKTLVQESSSSSSDPALEIYERWEVDRYHGMQPNERARNDYLTHIRKLIQSGTTPTQEQLDGSVADATASWNEKFDHWPTSGEPLIRALVKRMNPKPGRQEQANGTGWNGNGRHPGAGAANGAGNGGGHVDRAARERGRKHEWVLNKYGEDPNHPEPDIRDAIREALAYRANTPAASSGISR